MAKRQTAETYKDTKAAKNQNQQNYDLAQQASQQRSAGLSPGIGELKSDLVSGYQNLGTAGNVNAQSIGVPSLSSRQLSAPPDLSATMVSTGNLDDVLNSYKNLGPAYSDQQKTNIGGDVSGLRAIGNLGASDENALLRARGLGGFEQLVNNGGLDNTAINRMRGNGVWDEFATTGGYSPTARADIKAQAISPIGSYATGTRDELSRRLALSGGYGPGFDAANRALQRDTARAISDTSLNANISLQDRINQGRLAGVGGLTNAEQNLQGLRTGNILAGASGAAQSENAITQNKLSGLMNASQIEMGLQDRINQYKLAGLSGQEATSRAIADVQGINASNELRANMFNTGNRMATDQFNIGNENEIAARNASNQIGVGQFNASSAMGADEFNIQNQQRQELAKLAGMGGIYNTDVGQYQDELNRQQALLGGQSQSNLNYLNTQAQLGTQPGIGGNIMRGIGGLAGIVGGFIRPEELAHKMVGG